MLGASTLSTTSSQIGAGLIAASGATGPAAPFVAAAGGIAELVGAVANLFSGCGQTCVEATQIVNQAEPYFRQLGANYFSCPNRTTGDQQNYLAVFAQMWQQILNACGNPQLGSAGQRCITDRQTGGCTWKDSSGNCWNWWVGYHDPIANDAPPGGSGPPTACSTLLGGQYANAGSSSSLSSVASGISSVLSGSSSDSTMLLLALAVIVGVVLL